MFEQTSDREGALHERAMRFHAGTFDALYIDAARRLQAPLATRAHNSRPDDPTGENAEFCNGRHCFAEDLRELFTLRLHQHGFKVGAPGFHDYATRQLQNFYRTTDEEPEDIHQENPQRISDKGIPSNIHCALSMMGDTNQRLVTQSQFSLIN